jgi:hypothetical protein
VELVSETFLSALDKSSTLVGRAHFPFLSLILVTFIMLDGLMTNLTRGKVYVNFVADWHESILFRISSLTNTFGGRRRVFFLMGAEFWAIVLGSNIW